VAYWLLTGQLVFTAASAVKLLVAHAHTLPEPPSARTELPIPRELEALVLSCLAKDREQRPESARDLLQRLDTVPLAHPWTQGRAREWWQAHLPRLVSNDLSPVER
jgi:serine/threonine-protein kinase